MALTPEEIAQQQASAAAQQQQAQPTGLGSPAATQAPETTDVGEIAAGLMNRDSPLMKAAETRGRQYANARGLMNSTIGAQASQAAALEHVVPLASQTADQRFRSGLQTKEFEFQGAQNEAERGLRRDLATQEAGLRRELQTQAITSEETLARERMASDERLQGLRIDAEKLLQTERLTVEQSMQTERLLAEIAQAEADRALKDLINQRDIAANDRRGIETMLANAYNDYAQLTQAIMSNPELPASERNALLSNAKNMLTARINYTTQMYSTAFDWPPNPFVSDGGDESDGGSSGGSGTSRPEATAQTGLGGLSALEYSSSYHWTQGPSALAGGGGGGSDLDNSEPSNYKDDIEFDSVDFSGPGGFY